MGCMAMGVIMEPAMPPQPPIMPPIESPIAPANAPGQNDVGPDGTATPSGPKDVCPMPVEPGPKDVGSAPQPKPRCCWGAGSGVNVVRWLSSVAASCCVESPDDVVDMPVAAAAGAQGGVGVCAVAEAADMGV
mmetsp:Transcript_97558/g.275981  ORF Transcript_97558/g.275981 Transcript_97558/m.275981 type:complete len:133 (-) Transcript_97558:341-739(-)